MRRQRMRIPPLLLTSAANVDAGALANIKSSSISDKQFDITERAYVQTSERK